MKLSGAELQRWTRPPLRMSTILIGFTVPISVALDNLLLAVVLLGAIFNARAVWQLGAHHPVARAALLLFGWLFVAMFYGTASLSEAAGILGKYLDLAFIPLFMLLLTGPRERQWAQYSFLASMGLTLLLSYLVGLGILAPQHWMCADAGTANPVIFHSHITQNNMMAFAAFLALLNMRKAFSRRAQLAWGVFALLAMVNVLFMVQGRTGYMILSILLAWSAWSALCGYFRSRGKVCGWKQGLGLLLALVGFALAAYYTSPRLSERVSQVSAEYQVWQPNRGGDSSTGLRLDFYYNTLHIVQQHPLFGVGTGGFPEAYAQQTQGKDVMKIRNPHNEYLMIAAQTGVFGLLLLLHLFYAQWRNAPGLDTPFERDAARGLVLAYMVNCLFNSALLDHADGLFFAFMTAVLFAGMNREKKIG